MIVYQRSPDYLAADIDRAVAIELRTVVQFWWRNFAPRHFTERGAQIYRYERRSAEYMKRKQRVKRHQNPLEFSGLSKQMALGSITIQGSGDSIGRGGKRRLAANEARGMMPVPRYFFQFKTTKPIRKQEELTRLAPAEGGVLARVLHQRSLDRLEMMKIPETVSIE